MLINSNTKHPTHLSIINTCQTIIIKQSLTHVNDPHLSKMCLRQADVIFNDVIKLTRRHGLLCNSQNKYKTSSNLVIKSCFNKIKDNCWFPSNNHKQTMSKITEDTFSSDVASIRVQLKHSLHINTHILKTHV